MKFFLKPFFLFLILACSVSVIAQKQTGVDSASFSNAPYKVGEKLTYSVSFSNFSDAGFAELTVTGKGTYFNREGIELRANVQSNGVAIAFFSINNDYISYVAPESGKPYRTQKVANAGLRAEDISRDYDQSGNGEYDFLSALYRLRALPLTMGSSYRFTARYDESTYDVELQVKEKKIIKTNVGSFNAIVTQLRVNKNKEADGYRIKIYFSDDERHVPVLITVQHSAGEIRAELASSELPAEPKQQTTKPKEPVAKSPQTTNTPDNSANPVVTNPTLTNPTTNSGQPTSIPGINTNPIIIDQNGQPITTKTPLANPNNQTVSPLNPNATKRNPTQPNNSTPTPQPRPFPKDVPFTANEQLNFNIYWQNSQQAVGKVSSQISQRNNYHGRDGLMLTAKVDNASGAVSSLFTLNDTFISYIDPDSLLPFRSEVKLSNNDAINQLLVFDQDKGNVNTEKGARIDVSVGTHDLLSLAYALRLFDLAPNKKTPVSLFVNNRTLIVTITTERREVIELGGQSIKSVQLKLTIDDSSTNASNTINDKYALRLWVSDDNRRLPLRFSAKLSDGTLRADLAIIPTEK